MGSALGVQNDDEAVMMWIKARGMRSQNTARTYAKIAKRLLLWCKSQNLHLRDMKVNEAQQHLDALRHPSVGWLIPRDKNGKLLRPTSSMQTLKAPMSNKGVAFTRTVLGQLFQYLLVAGYVRRNVFLLTEIPGTIKSDASEKVISQAGMVYLLEWLDAKSREQCSSRKLELARERWVCCLLYYTGIRTKEAISGVMSDFVRDSEGWQLRVLGKGGKVRKVTVTNELGGELIRFREAIGMSAWPLPTDHLPLVPHIRRASQESLHISERMLRKIVDSACKSAARECEDPHISHELMRASPHWFRHTSATHRQEAGARLETTQQELGHANPSTTLRYAKIASRARREDAEKFLAASIKLRREKHVES